MTLTKETEKEYLSSKIRIEKPRRNGAASHGAPFISIIVLIVFVSSAIVFFPLKLKNAPSSFSPMHMQGSGDATWRHSDREAWKEIKKATITESSFEVRTGESGELTIATAAGMIMRLKSNSRLNRNASALELHQGTFFFVSPFEHEPVTVKTSLFHISFTHAALSVHTDNANNVHWISVLSGDVLVKDLKNKETRLLRQMQKMILQKDITPQISPVTPYEWQILKEIYDLQASESADGSDLRQSIHTGIIRDSGVFYDDKSYARSTIIQDSKSTAVKILYDVENSDSACGFYLKLNPTDITLLSEIHFHVRADKNVSAPDNLRLELKSKGRIIRSFRLRHFPDTWREVRFPLKNAEFSLVDELVFVFAHQIVGTGKQGVIYLKDFQLTVAPDSVRDSIELDKLEQALKNLDNLSIP